MTSNATNPEVLTGEAEGHREQLLSTPYDGPLSQKIRGLGEIYEVISVERTRKRLLAKGNAPDCVLILAPKRYWMEDVIDGREVIAAGFTDIPPWPSRPKIGGVPPAKWKIGMARIVFQVMVVFEQWFMRKNTPHMIYVLVKKGDNHAN